MSPKIYLCDLDAADRRFCVAAFRSPPYAFDIAFGEPALPGMRERGDDAMRLELDEDEGGLELPDVVSNIRNLLVLRRGCAKAIREAFELGEHEVVPVVLVNSKGRDHCTDYVAINPLGMFECLDVERSDMDGDDEDPTVRLFGKFWIDASRIPADRDLFRAKGVSGYMFSDRLHAFIREQGFTNFVFQEVQLS